MTPQVPRYRIGALHAQSWSGLVLSPGPSEGFAFRFAAELANGSRADGMDLFWLVHEVGARWIHLTPGNHELVATAGGNSKSKDRTTP